MGTISKAADTRVYGPDSLWNGKGNGKDGKGAIQVFPYLILLKHAS
jgi:hypothetical protein